MTLRSIFSLAALVSAATAPAVLAQTPPGPAGPPAGGGGMMMGLPRAADEVGPWAQRTFTRLDANQDGQVTGDELTLLSRGPIAAHGGSRIRALVSQSDTSRDARVSLEELTAGAGRMFARMDADGDGRLSDSELPQPPASRPAAMSTPTHAPEPMPMPGFDEPE